MGRRDPGRSSGARSADEPGFPTPTLYVRHEDLAEPPRFEAIEWPEGRPYFDVWDIIEFVKERGCRRWTLEYIDDAPVGIQLNGADVVRDSGKRLPDGLDIIPGEWLCKAISSESQRWTVYTDARFRELFAGLDA